MTDRFRGRTRQRSPHPVRLARPVAWPQHSLRGADGDSLLLCGQADDVDGPRGAVRPGRAGLPPQRPASQPHLTGPPVGLHQRLLRKCPEPCVHIVVDVGDRDGAVVATAPWRSPATRCSVKRLGLRPRLFASPRFCRRRCRTTSRPGRNRSSRTVRVRRTGPRDRRPFLTAATTEVVTAGVRTTTTSRPPPFAPGVSRVWGAGPSAVCARSWCSGRVSCQISSRFFTRRVWEGCSAADRHARNGERHVRATSGLSDVNPRVQAPGAFSFVRASETAGLCSREHPQLRSSVAPGVRHGRSADMGPEAGKPGGAHERAASARGITPRSTSFPRERTEQ